jgi:hypothetical protein
MFKVLVAQFPPTLSARISLMSVNRDAKPVFLPKQAVSA